MKPAWTLLVLAFGACASGPRPRPEVSAEELHAYARETRERALAEKPSPGSLWSGASVAPGADFKARKLHDIVLIQVVETTKASASSKTDLERESALEAGIARLLGLEDAIEAITSLVSGGSTSEFRGSGATSRSSSLRTTVAARVTEVLANGTLVVEARRRVAINGEAQGITLVGLVRPSDIDETGSVLSTQVADLQVVLDGKGVVSEVDHPGLLHRIAHIFLPL